MKERIRQHFHPSFEKELEKQLDFLGDKDILWILSDLNELNDNDFKIARMEYISDNNTIELKLRNDQTKKSISRTLILSKR